MSVCPFVLKSSGDVKSEKRLESIKLKVIRQI